MISLVQNAASTATRDADPVEIIRQIQSGEWREPIENIRRTFDRVLEETGDLKEAKKTLAGAKRKLPGILWSGQFSRRASTALLAHSGLLCADLDDLGTRLDEVRANLKTSPHLWAMFLSPTGNGLKAVFRVPADAEKHAASYRAVEKHVHDLTGEKIDAACKDIPRLCFASFDSEALHKADAIELPPCGEPREKVAASPSRSPNSNARRRVAERWLGKVEWTSETRGYCTCSGQNLHETDNAPRDCKIHLDGAPTLHCFHAHCAGILAAINHDLRSQIGKAEQRPKFAKSGSRANEYLGADIEPAAWGEPKPLPADLPSVPPFNFACLPDTFSGWIEDIAERMQCPPDFPAVGAMIALGSLVGRKIGIRPKRYDDWLVIPNLWGCVVGRPGLMKSPALEQPLLPLRRLVAEASERYTAEMQEHEVNAMLKSQRSELGKKKLAAHLKKGDEQAARVEAEAVLKKDADEPVCRRYETNDPTIEKLGVLLAENPTGLLLFRDELVGFLRGLHREGHESDRAIYLEMWNGTGTFTADRIQRGTVRTPSILSILGGIQPDLLTAYVREAVRGGQGADGLLQRFQLFVWPDVSKEWRNVDRWPHTEAKNRAFDMFRYLDGLTARTIGAEAETPGGIPFLRFTEDAQERFDSWRAELEYKLRSDTEHPAFEAHLSKYRKLVPALALLTHLANRATGAVTLAALNKALLWVTYLEAHARRIYSAVLRPDTAAARELAKHLGRGELPERFTLREKYRKGWAGLASKEDAEAATEILCDLGWIPPVADTFRTTGRPASPSFETNPKIRQGAPGEPTEPTKPYSDSSVSVPQPVVENLAVPVTATAPAEIANADLI